MNDSIDELKEVLARARTEAAKVVIGQEAAIRFALIAIFTNQHALIEGVPGVAKTLLVRTLAQILGSPFARIQFTPDLMPSDILGTNVFSFQKSEFSFVPGPIFTTFLLADEINPLPEAQKDRFMLKIRMDLPQQEEELFLAQRMLTADAPEAVLERGAVQTVISEQDLARVRTTLSEVLIRPELVAYLVEIVRESRRHESVLFGGGPRATQSLLLASRVHAALEGRNFVTPDDIRLLAQSVLEHRLVLRPEFEIEGSDANAVVKDILEKLPVPR
jgi:MoxR-like ATPase